MTCGECDLDLALALHPSMLTSPPMVLRVRGAELEASFISMALDRY